MTSLLTKEERQRAMSCVNRHKEPRLTTEKIAIIYFHSLLASSHFNNVAFHFHKCLQLLHLMMKE